ncbi:MAG: ABC transporter ATP-binding protein [Bacteroidota bacterium]
MGMILLSRLTKKFQDLVAVDALDLQIQRGEFFGFLGPNGAGKTTTIKMMTGLFAPTSGSITINGFDVQKEPLKAKMNIGYVPDQPFLYDKLTGREFLYFMGGLFSMSKTDIERRIAQLIELFEINSWIDKRTEDYSQGMRQRITIGSALLHDPKVIIIDEPMIGLDPRSAKIVKETLKRKTIEEGLTVFMSTHSLPTVEELCTRVGIINNGRLIFDSSIDQIRARKLEIGGKFEDIFLALTQ